jgi:hypothetical protein
MMDTLTTQYESEALEKVASAMCFNVVELSCEKFGLSPLSLSTQGYLLPLVEIQLDVSFSTKRELLMKFLSSQFIFVPCIMKMHSKKDLGVSRVKNPFYNLSIEEALIKADLLCNDV